MYDPVCEVFCGLYTRDNQIFRFVHVALQTDPHSHTVRRMDASRQRSLLVHQQEALLLLVQERLTQVPVSD